jgi:hypothetical protein
MEFTIQVPEEVAEALRQTARAQGLSVDEYIRTLLGVPVNGRDSSESSVDEFMVGMETLADEDVEPLPRDFSREDIYFPEG